MNTINLKEKLIKEERSAWFTFVDGFQLLLKYMSKKELERIVKRCTETVWKNHQPVEELNLERFAKEMAEGIKDWKGFTPEIAAKLLPVDVDELGEGEIACTETNKITLIENVYHFDEFLRDSFTAAERFQQKQVEEEAKN